MSIESINPATGEIIETFTPYTTEQVNAALDEAQQAFRQWRSTTFAERGALMTRVATYLRANKAELARVATLEMGKVIAEAEAEVEKCAWNCEFYAEHAEAFLADEPVATNAASSYIAYRPLGVVLAVMPWNFPYWQVIRFAAPALMAGNAGILKHASNVPQSALFLDSLFERGGFPVGSFRTLLISSPAVEAVLGDPRVKAVTLTGSEPAGRSVASI